MKYDFRYRPLDQKGSRKWKVINPMEIPLLTMADEHAGKKVAFREDAWYDGIPVEIEIMAITPQGPRPYAKNRAVLMEAEGGFLAMPLSNVKETEPTLVDSAKNVVQEVKDEAKDVIQGAAKLNVKQVTGFSIKQILVIVGIVYLLK